MNTNKRYGSILSSSEDPQKISLAFESVVRVIAIALGGYGALRGLNWVIPDQNIKTIADTLTATFVACGTIYHFVNLSWGLIRRGVNAAFPKQA